MMGDESNEIKKYIKLKSNCHRPSGASTVTEVADSIIANHRAKAVVEGVNAGVAQSPEGGVGEVEAELFGKRAAAAAAARVVAGDSAFQRGNSNGTVVAVAAEGWVNEEVGNSEKLFAHGHLEPAQEVEAAEAVPSCTH